MVRLNVSTPKTLRDPRLRRFLSSPEFGAVRRQWSARVSAYTLRRFDQFSRGGGNWPALTTGTVRGRRGGRSKVSARSSSLARTRDGGLVNAGKNVSILKDTGTLRNALRLGSPGNASRDIKDGIEYGIAGGPATIRVGSESIGKAPTVGQIARWHQDGAGDNPKRLIVVRPDAATLRAMRKYLIDGMRRQRKGV